MRPPAQAYLRNIHNEGCASKQCCQRVHARQGSPDVGGASSRTWAKSHCVGHQRFARAGPRPVLLADTVHRDGERLQAMPTPSVRRCIPFRCFAIPSVRLHRRKLFDSLWGTREMRVSLKCMDVAILKPPSPPSLRGGLPPLPSPDLAAQQCSGLPVCEHDGTARSVQVVMLGLDAAGKTTILYKLHIGEVLSTVPTIGKDSNNLALTRVCPVATSLALTPELRCLQVSRCGTLAVRRSCGHCGGITSTIQTASFTWSIVRTQTGYSEQPQSSR